MACIFNEISKLDDLQCLEVSSMHRYHYYADINADLGLNKFAKRTCTKRPVDDKKLWMLESSFKRMFISGFVAERKVLPALIAPPVKKASLISKISHLSGNMIKSLSLDYFQDITFLKSVDAIIMQKETLYFHNSTLCALNPPSNSINPLTMCLRSPILSS